MADILIRTRNADTTVVTDKADVYYRGQKQTSDQGATRSDSTARWQQPTIDVKMPAPKVKVTVQETSSSPTFRVQQNSGCYVKVDEPLYPPLLEPKPTVISINQSAHKSSPNATHVRVTDSNSASIQVRSPSVVVKAEATYRGHSHAQHRPLAGRCHLLDSWSPIVAFAITALFAGFMISAAVPLAAPIVFPSAVMVAAGSLFMKALIFSHS